MLHPALRLMKGGKSIKRPSGTPSSQPPHKPAAQRPAAQLRSGRDRLRDMVLGIPPAELAETPDYARYQVLLPQMLAQTVAPGSADYEWFMAFIAQWDECFAEYQDLQRAFADD